MTEAIQVQSIKKMASEITDSLHKASEAFTDDGSKAGAQSFLEAKGTESDKIKDLHRDMIDVHSSRSMTTDFGQKVSNTDHWLKVATEKYTGPHLLEDQQAREKASSADLSTSSSNNHLPRFIASTMSGFRSELFMLEELLHLANSPSSKAQRTLPLHLY